MKKLLLAGIALVLAGPLAFTPALTQEVKRAKEPATYTVSKKSAAARTALCKADCRPGNYQASGVGIHGLYRSYNQTDPHLTSIEGRKQFAECVKKCTDPLPPVYVQRAVFGLGLNWFGKTKQSCLDCHSKGH
jgi:hypothetical protein